MDHFIFTKFPATQLSYYALYRPFPFHPTKYANIYTLIIVPIASNPPPSPNSPYNYPNLLSNPTFCTLWQISLAIFSNSPHKTNSLSHNKQYTLHSLLSFIRSIWCFPLSTLLLIFLSTHSNTNYMDMVHHILVSLNYRYETKSLLH